MVETKIIILDQQEIVYKIHYKRIKNCYLRVEKGEVVIRCSPLFPQSEIEKLIRNHQEEILEQIKGYVPKYNYQEDGYVYLFNQKYQIVFKTRIDELFKRKNRFLFKYELSSCFS